MTAASYRWGERGLPWRRATHGSGPRKLADTARSAAPGAPVGPVPRPTPRTRCRTGSRLAVAHEKADDPAAYLYACVRSAALDFVRGGRRRAAGAGRGGDGSPAGERRPVYLPAGAAGTPRGDRGGDAAPARAASGVLVLKVWGLSFPQIGARSIPPDTAASRYRYALAAARATGRVDPMTDDFRDIESEPNRCGPSSRRRPCGGRSPANWRAARARMRRLVIASGSVAAAACVVVAVVLWQTGVIRTGFHVKVVNVYPHRPDDPRRPIAPAGPSCGAGRLRSRAAGSPDALDQLLTGRGRHWARSRPARPARGARRLNSQTERKEIDRETEDPIRVRGCVYAHCRSSGVRPARPGRLNNAAARTGRLSHTPELNEERQKSLADAAAPGGKLSDEHVKLLDDGRDARCTCAGAARRRSATGGCTTRTGRTCRCRSSSAPQPRPACRPAHSAPAGRGRRRRRSRTRSTPSPSPATPATARWSPTSQPPSSRWRRSRRGRHGRPRPGGAGPGGEAAGIPAPGGSLAATTRTEKESFFDWARTKLRAMKDDEPWQETILKPLGDQSGALEQAIEQAGGTRGGAGAARRLRAPCAGGGEDPPPARDQFLARHKELRAGVEKNLIGKLIVPA